MSPRLICVGDTVIDVTVAVSALPQRGGDVLAESGAMLAGGSGFNVMAAAGRLGVASSYGGMHGTGPFGDLARAAMLRENVEILLEPDSDLDTGWDVAITDAGSERTFITVVGAEARLTAERIARVMVKSGDVVYVSGYGLLGEPNRSAIVDWLGGLPQDVMVVTDPGPLVGDIPVPILDAVLARTAWWSCNLTEARAMTGENTPIAAAERLGELCDGVVVRLGADGCLVVTAGNRPLSVAGFPVEPVDSNGAGDAHVGAFIASLLAGLDPVAAAGRANAAAAIAVTRPGPATGPTTQELDAFLTAQPSP